MVLPEGLSFEAGVVLACSGGSTYHALRRAALASGESVAILGAGPTGLAATAIAHSMGARTLVLDRSPERLELARTVGADEVADTRNESAIEVAIEWAEGMGPEVVLEASGDARMQRESIEMARPGGRVALVGFGPAPKRDQPSLVAGRIIARGLTVIGAMVYPPTLFPQLAKFALDHKLPLEAIITERFPLEKAADAFRSFADGRGGKVILKAV